MKTATLERPKTKDNKPPSKGEIRKRIEIIANPRIRSIAMKWFNRSDPRIKSLRPRAPSILELNRHPEIGVTPREEMEGLKLYRDGKLPHRFIEPLLILKWRHGNNAQAVIRRAAERMGIKLKSN